MVKGKVLIAGGTGFIGSNIARLCIDKGFEVISISINPPKTYRKVDLVKYIQHNLINPIPSKVLESLGSTDYIINCSGYIDHKQFYNGGLEIFNQHFISTKNLVEYASEIGIKTFINIGSSDEYGNQTSPIKESCREAPISPYSLGKLCSTQLMQLLYRQNQFPSVVIRPFLVFGEGQSTNRFLPHVIRNCLNNNSFPVSEGKQLRDFCYIRDFSEGIISCFDNPYSFGKIINLASGNPISVLKVTELVKDIIGKGQPIFGAIPYRVDESMELFADIKLAREILNWTPDSELIDSLKNTISWYVENYDL